MLSTSATSRFSLAPPTMSASSSSPGPAPAPCRWLGADDLPAWLGTFRGQETALSAVRFTPAEWNFAVGKSTGLFEKLQGMPVKLGDIADMFVGLQTSADTVF